MFYIVTYIALLKLNTTWAKIKPISLRLLFYLILFSVFLPPLASDELAELKEKNKKGISLAEKGEYESALKIFSRSLKSERLAAITYHNIGYTHQLRGNRETAIKFYQKSIDRNPKILPPRQKLGRVLYEQEEYEKAIEQGEMLLKMSPKDPTVREWLPDAYEKLTQQRLRELARKRKQAADGSYPDDSTPNALQRFGVQHISISYDAATTFALNKGSSQTEHIRSDLGLLVPMSVYMEIISTLFLVGLKYLSPDYPGTALPYLVEREAQFELLYRYREFNFGLGFMYGEMKFSEASIPGKGGFLNTKPDKATDIKLGLLFKYRGNKWDSNLTIYPRYLFRDTTGIGSGTAYDRNIVSIDAYTKASESDNFFYFRYWLGFNINEWYIIEYLANADRGHYLGYYDLTFGTFVGNFQKRQVEEPIPGVPIELKFSMTIRLYFIDLNDPDPLAFGNGQGFFGVETLDIAGGEPLPGYHGLTILFKLSSKQRLFNLITLEELISFEYAPSGGVPRHMIGIHLKLAFQY